MANFSVLNDFDFSGYLFGFAWAVYYNCNWKTSIEVNLEDYQSTCFIQTLTISLVQIILPGNLATGIVCRLPVSTVAVYSAQARLFTQNCKKEQVLSQYDGQLPPHDAMWLFYFLFIMHARMVSAYVAHQHHIAYRW